MSVNGEVNWLVYDGDCPFCSNFARLLAFRRNIGPVALIDARGGGAEVDEIRQQGLSLDEGMVLKYSGTYYHGDECLHALTALSEPAGLFNNLNIWMFRNKTRARLLYPVLRGCRNLVLRFLGRKKIEVA